MYIALIQLLIPDRSSILMKAIIAIGPQWRFHTTLCWSKYCDLITFCTKLVSRFHLFGAIHITSIYFRRDGNECIGLSQFLSLVVSQRNASLF